ncbi:Transcription factor TFIIE [Forsythia ovata]|uniref:Transcription factor TFIIE n=1 Tax=Forsythia ovata TaxID=205694 RepID=A0ABD1PGI3_9LAMI
MQKQQITSYHPFNRLVKFVARAFYDGDVTTKGDNQQKTGRGDDRGIAMVVLDAVTGHQCQWVREEDLADDLKLHSKQLRQTLVFLEKEKLVARNDRKETAKGEKIYSAAKAANVYVKRAGREGVEKIKKHTHSYCCLDYAQPRRKENQLLFYFMEKLELEQFLWCNGQ